MTLVAVWNSGPRLQAIADTRLVRAPGNVLTEHGPKILPMTIVCKNDGPSPEVDIEVLRTTIGFAYSGSTLSALSSHALANALCSNLLGPTGAPIPTLAEIAAMVANIATSYMREVGQLAGPNALFSAILFGFRHRTQMYCAFEIRPDFAANGISVQVIEHNLAIPDLLLTIGSNTELLRQRTVDIRAQARLRGDPEVLFVLDSPTRALQSIIDDAVDESIGGTIQQAWTTPAGFRALAKAVPILNQPPAVRNIGLFILGFDVLEMQNVGSYIVAPMGRSLVCGFESYWDHQSVVALLCDATFGNMNCSSHC